MSRPGHRDRAPAGPGDDDRALGKHRAAGPGDEPVRSSETVARHRAAPPGGEAEEIIVGIAAAACYLGYDKPDGALRSWQSKRKIAGNRPNPGEPGPRLM